MKHQITISKRTALSAALCMALGSGVQAATFTSSTFTMLGASGGTVGVDKGVTGSISKSGAISGNTGETFSVASTTPFFGLNWTAHSGTIFGPGTYNFATTEGGTYTGVVVGSGQVGGHVLFNWGTTTNIDVVMVWDLSYDKYGNVTYTSSDPTVGGPTANPDGYRGVGMIDGAFPNFSANFDFIVPPTFPITLTKPVVVFNAAGQIVSTDLTAGPYTFSWSNTTVPAAAWTNADSTSMTFDGSNAAINTSATYTVSVTVTRDADSETVRADIPIQFINLSLSSSNDSDGDGVDDSTEGSSDSNSNGIPDFLDNSNLSTRQLAVDTSEGTSGRILTADSGVFSIGTTAQNKGASNLQAGTLAWGVEVTADDIGTTDDKVTTSCVGGCYDFKITGLSNGATAKVVIPLSTELPSYPTYRKYAGGTWQGFKIDDNNSISSAPALSTDPVTCPTAGSSSYSNVGLTPGDYCIQLTIEDGGPNDADGDANGTIVDPGGIGTTGEEIMVADVPNGCSMSTTPVNPTERADWWLVAGFLGALAWLRGMRRKGHAA